MRLLRYILLSVFLAGCLCGCEYYFPLEGLDNDSKLYVQCIAGNSERTYINVQKALGVNSTGEIMPDVENISLKVNGRECSIEKLILPDPPQQGYYDPEIGYIYREDEEYDSDYWTLRRYNLWYTDAPIKDGDDLSLEVAARGMESVSANVKVPQKVVIQEVNAAPRCSTITEFDNTYRMSYMSFDVSLADISADDYYGLCIEMDVTTSYAYFDGHTETYSHKNYGNIITWDSGSGMTDVLESQGDWIDAYYNNYFIDSYASSGLHLIPGSCLKDGHLKFDCNLEFSSDSISDVCDFDENGQLTIVGQVHIKTDSKYKVSIYRVSPEFYRFNKAQYLLRTNYLAELGLSPSTFSYTNVRGGFGVLGALTCSSTPWYQAPAEPE